MTTDGLTSESIGEETPSIDWETTYNGWVNEAMTHIQRGELLEAMPYLNLCLERSNNNNLHTTGGLRHANGDELSLLEKRCLIHMKLKMYDKIFDDANRMLNKKANHTIAFKCLVAGFCKLNKLNYVKEVFKRWEKESPKDLQMIEARTKVMNLIAAVQNGIEASDAFSKVEETLGLKYDWLLEKKVTDSTWKYRPCPMGNEQLVLCLTYRYGHCSLGERCAGAHSEEELKEWEQRRSLWKSAQGANLTNTDDIWTKYMNSISSEVDNLRKDQTRTTDFEAECDISIISLTPTKCQVTSLLKPHLYEFRVKSKKHRLTHVCLFDDLHRPYFKISAGYLKDQNNKTDLLERRNEEFNLAYDQLLEIPSNLQYSGDSDQSYIIEVSFETTVFGTFKQTLVFDFEEQLDDNETPPKKIKVLRELQADVVLSDDMNYVDPDVFLSKDVGLDKDSTATTGGGIEARAVSRPRILSHSRTWNFGNSEIVDSFSGTKVSSTKVGFALISSGRPSPETVANVQDILTKHNYKEKMRHFLTQEERARQEILSKYNILAQLATTDTYEMKSAGKEGTQYAPEGTLFARMVLFRDVSEDTAVGRLILRNCNYVLISKDEKIRAAEEGGFKPKVYLCKVMEKTKNVMYFELGNAICDDLELANNGVALFQVQFQLDRTSFIQQKLVIDLMKPNHLDLLFPDFTEELQIPWNPIKQWNPIVENDQFRLNPKQKEALIAVTCEDVTPPILIIGPFGTGKTFTLAQCIRTILLQQKTRILICTHSNSAADLYVKEYLDPLTNEFEDAKPLRIYFELRNLSTVHAIVQKYCKIDKGRFVMPSKEEILSHRVIVVTLSTSFDLINLDLEEDTFSHILLDEAAQAMESEAITPLLAAGRSTKLVLAGDYMQLSPELFSSSRHFQVSLLERLHCVYTEPNPCKILLCENYRSHPAIIQFASDAFYKKKLKCGKMQPAHGTYYPLTFFCARGEDIQEKDSNSYYNMAEVYEVCEKVSELVSSWPESWGDWREESAIGILTAYPDQVTRIRSKLRSKGLGSISVERVLNVQGKQFRAIFISTVRTSKPWVHILPGKVSQEVDLGFLSNAKLLNTALTRAQSLIAVVGDPVSLCSLGRCKTLWKDFMELCNENKSLYGISYSQIRQSILGTELRFTWGLNPLANDFEPIPRGKPEQLPSEIEEEFISSDPCTNTEIIVNGSETENATNETATSANDGDMELVHTGLQENSVERESTEVQIEDVNAKAETPKGAEPEVSHIRPASEFWHNARNTVIQNHALRQPHIAAPPFAWAPGFHPFPPYYPFYPPGQTPIYHAWTPPFVVPYAQLPPRPVIHPGNSYRGLQPNITPPSNQAAGSDNLPVRNTVPLSSAQYAAGVPLQRIYPQPMPQGPPPRAPNSNYINAQTNGPWSPPGRVPISAPSHSQAYPVASNQTFTQEEISTMKRALEYYQAAQGGQANMSHNRMTPVVENLHQKLSIVENARQLPSMNHPPNRFMGPPNRMNMPMPIGAPPPPYFARMPSPGPPGPQSSEFPTLHDSAAAARRRIKIENTVARINQNYPKNDTSAQAASTRHNVPNHRNQQAKGPSPRQDKVSGSCPSSSRSYANVLKKSQKSEVSNGSNSSVCASTSGHNTHAVTNTSSTLVAASTNNMVSNPDLRPEIVPLMSVPIPEHVTVNKGAQTNGLPTSTSTPGNKGAANSKKSRKKK